VALVGSDTIVLSDSAAHLEALSAVEIAALATAGIDRVEASGGSLALSVAQAQALGTIALTPANTVTLADTGAHVAALRPRPWPRWPRPGSMRSMPATTRCT
jgi:hypothetical protein